MNSHEKSFSRRIFITSYTWSVWLMHSCSADLLCPLYMFLVTDKVLTHVVGLVMSHKSPGQWQYEELHRMNLYVHESSPVSRQPLIFHLNCLRSSLIFVNSSCSSLYLFSELEVQKLVFVYNDLFRTITL